MMYPCVRIGSNEGTTVAAKDEDKPQVTADDIMSPKEMKPLFARAKRGGKVFCVIGFTKEKDGIILLDRKKPAKQLRGILLRQADEIGLEVEAPSLRFGEATVDKADDPKLITFTVNKDAPGALRLALLPQAKKAGFSDVEILVGGEGGDGDDDNV